VVSRDAAGRGLGRAVLRAVEDGAVAAGCAVVRLDCVQGDAALRRWYLTDGYRVVGSRDWAAKAGGRLLPAVLLEKRWAVVAGSADGPPPPKA
jgi:hypothetical protein